MRRQAFQVATVVYVSLAMLAFLVGAGSAEAGKRERADKSISALPSDGALRYMPTKCQAFARIDLTKLRQNGVTEGMALPEQAERVTIGWTSMPAIQIGDQRIGEDNFVAVIALRCPASVAELWAKLVPPKAQAWHDEVVAGLALRVQTSDKPMAIGMPAKQTAVFGKAELVREVLTRGGPAKLPEKLAAVCQRLDRSQAVALALAVPDMFSSLAFLPAELRKGVESVSFYFDVNQAGSQVRLVVDCVDRSIAAQLQGVLGGCLQLVSASGVQPPEVVAFLTSLDYTVKDRSLVVRGAFPTSLLLSAVTPSAASAVSLGKTPAPTLAPEPQLSSPYYARTPTVPSPAYMPATGPGNHHPQPSPSPYAPGSTGYAPALPYTPSTSNAPATWKPLPPAAPSLYDPTPQQPAATSDLAKRLNDRCAELERRLRLAEQDRDLLAQRVELYRKQVDEYRRQIDTYLEEPSRVHPPLDRSLAK